MLNGPQRWVSLADLECLDSCLLVVFLDTKSSVAKWRILARGPLHMCGVGSLKGWRRGSGCQAFYSHLPQRRSEVRHSSPSGKCLGTTSDLCFPLPERLKTDSLQWPQLIIGNKWEISLCRKSQLDIVPNPESLLCVVQVLAFVHST